MEHNTKNIKISDNIYLNYFTIEQNNLINLLNEITKNNIVLSMMYENNTLSIYTQNPISIKEKVNIEIKYEETMIPLINETTISLQELYEIHKRIRDKIQDEIEKSINSNKTLNFYNKYFSFNIKNNGIIIYYVEDNIREEIAFATEKDIIFKDNNSIQKMRKLAYSKRYKNIEFYQYFTFMKNQLTNIYQKYNYFFQSNNIKSINSNISITITPEDIQIDNLNSNDISLELSNLINNNSEIIIFYIHDLPKEILNERNEFNKEKDLIVTLLSDKIKENESNISLKEIINKLSIIKEPLYTYLNCCEFHNQDKQENNIDLIIKSINDSEKKITLCYDNFILTSFIVKNNTITFDNTYYKERYELMKKYSLLEKINYPTNYLDDKIANEFIKEDIEKIMNDDQDNKNENLLSINDFIKIINNYDEELKNYDEKLKNKKNTYYKLTSSFKRIDVYLIDSTKLEYSHSGSTLFIYNFRKDEIIIKKWDNNINEEKQKNEIEKFISKLLIEKPLYLIENLEKEKEKQKVNQKKKFGLFN